jgi:hypothetical protein
MVVGRKEMHMAKKKAKKSKKPESTIGQRLARLRALHENLATNRSLLKTYQERQSPRWFEQKAAEQQAIIDAANAKIAEFHALAQSAARSAKDVAAYIRRDEKELKTLLNFKKIMNLEKLMDQAEELQAQIREAGFDPNELLGKLREQNKTG